jgi:peptidoglycan/LPS O-acetylase OafA/YrhL
LNIHSTYRADIDGLRAIAVLSVLAYHYGVTAIPGGFTGVDAFFVISGFLITTMLFQDIENGRFSLLSFYDRRIRRILPALIVMLLVAVALGYAMLNPGDYVTFARSAFAASFGASNIFFYGNTGYFDRAAELQPLLHTWSLVSRSSSTLCGRLCSPQYVSLHAAARRSCS